MQEILEAIQGAPRATRSPPCPSPRRYRAAHVLRAEQTMWDGRPVRGQGPRKSLHIGEVPTPELAPTRSTWP